MKILQILTIIVFISVIFIIFFILNQIIVMRRLIYVQKTQKQIIKAIFFLLFKRVIFLQN